MPLNQPDKDSALTQATETGAALKAWPADVPEREALIEQSDALLAGIEAAVVPPPQPIQLLDPMVVTDLALNQGATGNVGGTTSESLYNPLFHWKTKGGDVGALLGTTAALPIGKTGPILIPITLPPDCTQICLRAKSVSASAPTMTFNSRSTLVGPQITYTLPDGTQTSALALADVECNVSTQKEIGGNQTLQIRPGGSAVYVRFPPAPEGVTQALLTLSLVGVSGAQGIVEVYDGTIRLGPVPTETTTLKGDPRVFFETQCFEDAPQYMKAYLFGDPANSFAIDKYHQRNVVADETGEKVLQLTFDPTVNAVCSMSVLFPDAAGQPGGEADEAALEFDIRFLPEMENGLTQGFKCAFGWSSNTKNDDAAAAKRYGFPIGRAGTLLAGNGGAKAHGNDGWTLRFDAYNIVNPPEHPLYQRVPIMQYVYWPEQIDYYGDGWPWELQQFSPRLGEWYTITQHAKVNTVNADGTYNKDAFLHGYLNHGLALKREGFYLRTTDKPLIAGAITPSTPWAGVNSKLAIGRIWFNVYHGGVALPRRRCSFQIRNFRAAKFA